MSAPAPRDPHGDRTRRELGQAADAQARVFAGLLASAKSDNAAARTPYTRPGYPDWQLFTAEQWSNFDSFNELFDGMERKYGRFMPRSAAMMRANRGVW